MKNIVKSNALKSKVVNLIGLLLFIVIVIIFPLVLAILLIFERNIPSILRDVSVNILASFIFVFLFWYLGEITIGKRHKKIVDFFGITRNKKIVCYFSDLRIILYGTIGLDNKGYSYKGDAIASMEFMAGMQFRLLLNVINPLYSELPRPLQNLLYSDVDISFLVTREFTDRTSPNGVIILGTPVYNPASKFLQDNNLTQIKLEYIPRTKAEESSTNISPSGIRLESNGTSGGTINPLNSFYFNSQSITPFTPGGERDEEEPILRISNHGCLSDISYGFIERIVDSQNSRYYFYCVGLSDSSTAGAAFILQKEWEKICSEFPTNKDFLIPIMVRSIDYKSAVRISWKDVPFKQA